MDERLASYCGLCCGDCIPSRADLFALAADLDRILADLRFEEYAALKAEGSEKFEDYPTFLSVLQAIRDLQCPARAARGAARRSARYGSALWPGGMPAAGSARSDSAANGSIASAVSTQTSTSTST